VALPHLHALARESGETVDLEVLRGASTVIVEEVAGDRVLSASANLGRTYPAALTSTGKALLAHLPPGELDALVPAGDPLRDELALTRARGYATSYEELEAFLHAVGAPIFDHAGRAVAAISISGPAARMPREREAALATPVVAACRAISEELGFRPAP
jgi:DNA-binding IclR family transcriptional regulator